MRKLTMAEGPGLQTNSEKHAIRHAKHRTHHRPQITKNFTNVPLQPFHHNSRLVDNKYSVKIFHRNNRKI